ncbi:MAG: sulfotransferase [Bacteroidetes bacterium]|nr:sulfotransferase [Bacteroidota bacterium]
MIAQLNKHYPRISLFKTYQRLVAYFLFEGRPLTTKGQWFNTFVKAWLKFVISISKPELKHPPVFIIGTGRSGTTLLGMLLSMHKKYCIFKRAKNHLAYG